MTHKRSRPVAARQATPGLLTTKHLAGFHRARLKRASAWLAVAFAFTFTATAQNVEGVDVSFRFAPGTNINFKQSLTMVKERDLGQLGVQQDKSVSTASITITQTDSGWEVSVVPTSVQMWRNGEQINDPIVELLAGGVVTYKVNSDGHLQDIEGYEEFLSQLEEQVPAQVFEALKPVLNVDAMKAKSMAEWEGRIGAFVGLDTYIGEQFHGEIPYQIPNGPTIQYSIETSIDSIVPCDNHQCVKIVQSYDSQSRQLSNMVNDMASDLISEADYNATDRSEETDLSQSPGPNTASIRGHVNRLIDPKTMLVYGEESSRTIVMEVDIPGAGPVPAEITETRAYSFDYSE